MLFDRTATKTLGWTSTDAVKALRRAARGRARIKALPGRDGHFRSVVVSVDAHPGWATNNETLARVIRDSGVKIDVTADNMTTVGR